MNHSTRTIAARRVFRVESLESRSLLASGVSTSLSALRDLGVISRPAAVRGIEGVLSIDAGQSVTFQFSTEAAGLYAVRLRHEGDGLTMVARTPSESTPVPLGPAGRDETMVVPLEVTRYQVEVRASGNESASLDWELQMISESEPGHSGPVAPPATPDSIPIPLPGPGTITGHSPTVSPSSPMTPAFVAKELASPVCTGEILASRELIGRPEVDRPIASVGPTTLDGSMALAFDGEGLPPVVAASEPVLEDVEATASTLTSDACKALAFDEAFLDAEPWWCRLALSIAPMIAEGGPAVDEDELLKSIESDLLVPLDHERELAMLRPGQAATLVISGAIIRRWLRKSIRSARSGGRSWSTRRNGLIRELFPEAGSSKGLGA